MGVLTPIGPAGTTDLTQVIDRGIGNMYKQRMKALLDDDWLLDVANFDRFTKAPGEGGLKASEKRVLITNLVGDAWEEVKASQSTIVKCAEECGALIGVGGTGIEKFCLPRQGSATLDVDFNNVGDSFADRSDDDDDGDDVIDAPPRARRRATRARPSNDDDDGDDDSAGDDDDDNANDADSDDDLLSDDDDDDDDVAGVIDDNSLIAPHGYVLLCKGCDEAFKFDSTRVGSELLRMGARTALRRATIARVATAKDKNTDRSNNYAVRFVDDNTIETVTRCATATTAPTGRSSRRQMMPRSRSHSAVLTQRCWRRRVCAPVTMMTMTMSTSSTMLSAHDKRRRVAAAPQRAHARAVARLRERSARRRSPTSSAQSALSTSTAVRRPTQHAHRCATVLARRRRRQRHRANARRARPLARVAQLARARTTRQCKHQSVHVNEMGARRTAKPD